MYKTVSQSWYFLLCHSLFLGTCINTKVPWHRRTILVKCMAGWLLPDVHNSILRSQLLERAEPLKEPFAEFLLLNVIQKLRFLCSQVNGIQYLFFTVSSLPDLLLYDGCIPCVTSWPLNSCPISGIRTTGTRVVSR